MPLIGIVRFFTSLLSLILLAAAIYLIWSWSQGTWIRMPDGDLAKVREDWRLWTGGGLLLWSFVGRPVMLMLLARPDERAVPAQRENGQMVRTASGTSLYIETHGPAGAPPIIFTHGWGMDSTMWRYAKADLARRFQLVLWDLPGLGKSPRPAKREVDLREFASDLASLVLLSDSRPVLVGHSIGGMTIQTLARDHPEIMERVAGLVLLNTTYTNPLKTMILSGPLQALRAPILEPAMRLMILLEPLVWLSQWQSYLSGHAHLAQRIGFGKFVTRSQLDQVALLATRNSPAVQMHGNLAMFRWDAAQAMRSTRVPILVIGGDTDLITKLEASRTIAGERQDSRLHVADGANHMGPMECAAYYNQLIGDFALSVQSSPQLDARSFANREDTEGQAAEVEDHRVEGSRPPRPPV